MNILKIRILNLKKELEKDIIIYNDIKHSSSGYTSNFIFNSDNENLFSKVKVNTFKSQKKYSNCNRLG